MRIYLREISENETVLDFVHSPAETGKPVPSTPAAQGALSAPGSVEVPWLRDAVESCHEQFEDSASGPSGPEGLPDASIAPRPKSATRKPITAHFGIRKVDDVFVVSGEVQASIRLFCSRCASPFAFAAHPRFSALYCKDPVMAGVAHLAPSREGGVSRPVGQNHGRARHAHDTSNDDEGAVQTDITYITEDFIDLADVVIEQIQIQLPFQPLCKESCKGVCQSCGADLNVGRCACSKILKQTPFSVLQGFKARG
jgi:uncharacterized protein